jgi:hypothetical protein
VLNFREGLNHQRQFLFDVGIGAELKSDEVENFFGDYQKE